MLEEADVPFMPMHDLHSVLEDPHLAATGFFKTIDHPSEGAIRTMAMPISFANSPPAVARPTPRLGEHTVEVLTQAGIAVSEIDALLASGAACQSVPRAAQGVP